MFIIKFLERDYGITAKHVFKGFNMSDLVVTRDMLPQKGTSPAPIERFALIDGDASALSSQVRNFNKNAPAWKS